MITAANLARLTGMAAHPTAMGTAPAIREADVSRGFKPLSQFPPAGSVYPRAVIKVVPGFVVGKPIYAGKIWRDACCPLIADGRWLTVVSTDLGEVAAWAEETVERVRNVSPTIQYVRLRGELAIAGDDHGV